MLRELGFRDIFKKVKVSDFSTYSIIYIYLHLKLTCSFFLLELEVLTEQQIKI